jgi:hypothetical protein
MTKTMTRLMLSSVLACSALAFMPAHAATPDSADMAKLVKKVAIPFKQFTLKNGLRVLVHTDRKAPIVAVSVWYDVGSKHEPKGKTGFAHLVRPDQLLRKCSHWCA